MALIASPPQKGMVLSDSSSSSSSAAVSLIQLDDRTSSMTVEEYLKDVLAGMVRQAEDTADEALDSLNDTYKTLRENLQNLRHEKKAEEMARKKAAKKKVFDVVLTVEETPDDNASMAGKQYRLTPRQQREGGMCKIGRSGGEDFHEPKGLSLPKDYSISTWHGKFTSIWGVIYYTDLNTRNGSKHNGVRVEKDFPVALKSGDSISLGDTLLRVELVPVASPSSSSSSARDAGAGGEGSDGDIAEE